MLFSPARYFPTLSGRACVGLGGCRKSRVPLLVVGKAGGWIPCTQLLLPHIEWYIGGLCQSRLRLLCQNTCSAARICDSHDHASTQKFLQHCKNSVQACTNRIRLQSADHLYSAILRKAQFNFFHFQKPGNSFARSLGH